MNQAVYNLSHVEMRYGSRTVLNIDSLEIERGEVLAVVGPSGAGKSTLLRLLALLEMPTSGQIMLKVNGQLVGSRAASVEDQRRITMVFQRPVLLSRTVRENVAYGLRLRGEHDGSARVEAALDRVSMLDLADALPRTLSGGELQRVAIARAMVLEPRVLLLDEPTANLDPYNVRLIEELISEQHKRYGTTIVMVTHNVFQARRLATRVALLLEGALVETAPNEPFFTSPSDPRTAAFVSGDLVY